ncbi:hypothetical protein [Brevundimonas sp. Root1279]|uniref:hypothetical protein n=1 Tax=Brevundimonas sp. Root1279 TaxID=1736443 RepID=UPI00071381AC|nr:hypothetical protein [Brevundimonas sp. Root1279]KQW82439.1 hypothetical protein ASC65_09345 [Brevundimonas sp. Root1279]
MTIRTALVRAAAIAALGLTTSGCVAKYVPVEAGQPAAEVTVHKSYSGTNLWIGGMQSYNLGPDEFCDTTKLGAVLSMLTEDSKALRVAPGKPIVLSVTTTYMWGTGAYSSASSTCFNAVRFTPEQDQQYDVRHTFDVDDKYCRLIITDRATGKRVRDAEPLPLSECRKRARR